MKKISLIILLGFLLFGCAKSSFKETIWNFKEREGHSAEITDGKGNTKYFFVIRINKEDYKNWLEKYRNGEEFTLELNARINNN